MRFEQTDAGRLIRRNSPTAHRSSFHRNIDAFPRGVAITTRNCNFLEENARHLRLSCIAHILFAAIVGAIATLDVDQVARGEFRRDRGRYSHGRLPRR